MRANWRRPSAHTRPGTRSTESDCLIETENLTRRFGDTTALDELNLQVKEGEVFGSQGPNGAGKTTTVRMLSCFISKTSGEATVGGYHMGDADFFKMLGLWDKRDVPVGTFSKEMKQKLAIARALVHDSQILFLNEPTANLDPEASKTVRDG